MDWTNPLTIYEFFDQHAWRCKLAKLLGLLSRFFHEWAVLQATMWGRVDEEIDRHAACP
ncbi:MAG: hypothetical protein WDO69_11620 [Pseudomonadota bacterium]